MLDLLDLRNRYKYSISQNGDISIYKSEYPLGYIRIYDLSELEGNQLLIDIIGFKRVSFNDNIEDEIDIPDQYITALIYYVRSKGYLENGDAEKHNYYYSLFINELKSKTTVLKDIKSEPSEYSLR